MSNTFQPPIKMLTCEQFTWPPLPQLSTIQTLCHQWFTHRLR